MKTTLVVPTLNEINNFKIMMPKIKPEWCEQVIILDGKSDDGTIEYATRMGYEVFVQKEEGLWNAYRELFQSGMIKGDIVVTFSPDGNSIPEGIPVLIDAIKLLGNDIVIASRYACGAKSYDDSKLTRFGNWMFTALVNVLCRGKYTDALVMFRAYRVEVAEQLGFTDGVPKVHKWASKLSSLASWESPMAIRAVKAGLNVAEIPVDEPANLTAVRRENWIKHGFVILAQILYEGLWRKKN